MRLPSISTSSIDMDIDTPVGRGQEPLAEVSDSNMAIPTEPSKLTFSNNGLPLCFWFGDLEAMEAD
jgi:hypothetical protein